MTSIDSMELFDRIVLYRTFTSVSEARAMAGLLYESLCHARIREGVTLTLKPMERTMEQTFFHWKSREGQGANSMDVDDLTVVFPRNTVAFDSFFLLGGILYSFQFPVSSSHEVKIGMKDLLSRAPNIPPKNNWRFVFITPPGCEVNAKATPEVKEFLDGVGVYLAHLEVEHEEKFHIGKCVVL
jgi:hypothetical protein